MTHATAGGRTREAAVVAILLLALMATTLALGRAWFLVREPAWLDEFHTLLVAGEPDASSVVRALERGGDFNPPLLHFFVRGVAGVTGGLDVRGIDVLPLRLAFLTLAWLTVFQLFLTLRERFELLPSVAGAVAVWAHPLVVEHAFELRFYGLWLLCTLLLARAAGLPERSRVRAPLVVVTSVAACLIHYFAILSWGLILWSTWTSVREAGWRRRVKHVLPLFAGPVALALALPLYVGQRASLSVPTWVEPTTLRIAWQFLFTTPGWLLIIGVAVAWAARLGLWPRATTAPQGPWTPALRSLLFLLLLPLVILVLSAVVQPAVIDRYAIVAVLGVAPVMAWATGEVAPRQRPVVIGILAAVACAGSWLAGRRVDERSERRRSTLATFRTIVPHDALVVVCARHDLYPLLNARPALPQRFVLAGIPSGRPDGISTFHVLEHDVARRQKELFGYPSVLPIEAMRARDELYVVEHPMAACQKPPWLHDRRTEVVAPHVYRVTGRALGLAS